MFDYRPPQSPWLDILHRDNDLLILNKPAGLLTVPGKHPEHKDSLQLRVQRVLPEARIVHRLDMATSGIILMPMSKAIQGALGKQFEARSINKRYLAVVAGQVTQDSGTIDLPLRCDWPNRPKQMVDHEQGKRALTHFEVVARYNDHTRVALTPVTGRSHQLRVHMQQLGHPILGDRLYSNPEDKAPGKADESLSARVLSEPRNSPAGRLMLHAEMIEFVHPSTGKTMRYELPAPF